MMNIVSHTNCNPKRDSNEDREQQQVNMISVFSSYVRFIYSKCSIRSDVVAVNFIHIWHGYIKNDDIECEKKQTKKRTIPWHKVRHNPILYLATKQSERKRKRFIYSNYKKCHSNVFSVCTHVIYSEWNQDERLFINVDFKPSKEWQSERVMLRKRETRITYILKCVCFIRLMRWSESHTRTHTCCKHT